MKAGFFPLIIAILLVVSCSSSGGTAVSPQLSPTLRSENGVGDTNRLIWGIWDVRISEDRSNVEITYAREAAMHLNAVRLLEVTPCTTCLRIANIQPVDQNVLEADVTLTHPFPGLVQYTGFDVRGIFITRANYSFAENYRRISIGGSYPKMLNADGFTTLFNPTEYPPDFPVPPALKYFPGRYSTYRDLTATLNPYLAFRKDAPRCMFEAGGSETQTARIYAPPGPVHFGYAVDVCWQPVDNVIDPLEDFPPEANCLEAYKISVTMEDSNSSVGSSTPIWAEVFDHQGFATISTVIWEAPNLQSGVSSLDFVSQTGDDSFLYTGRITNALGAVWGDYPFLIKVHDNEIDPNLGAIDAWQSGMVHVKKGWARSWGGGGFNTADGVAIDQAGYIYASGFIEGPCDLDPGLGVDMHDSNGSTDMALSKFDSNGVYVWGRTWGGTGWDDAYRIALDDADNLYVLGTFAETVDFDPGPGEEIRTANDAWDLFVSKFSADGTFQWVKTWEAEDWVYCTSICYNHFGGLYIAGNYNGIVDFDPGEGEDFRNSRESGQAVLIKIDTDGNYEWARAWGSNHPLSRGDEAVAVAADSYGNALTTGFFSRTVDFDPGPDEDIHSAAGYSDAFLTIFNPAGDHLGAMTWGGSDGSDEGRSISVSASGVYVGGDFEGTVDMDPGPGEDIHVGTADSPDMFLSKFDLSGNFQWARTWGGNGQDYCETVCAGIEMVYVGGTFVDSVDFDTGPGMDIHTAEDNRNSFLSAFTHDGNFVWARSWDTGSDAVNVGAHMVINDMEDNALLAGSFSGTPDFDPTTGVDEHESIDRESAFITKLLHDGSW
jgi:hypothetical protein